MLSTGLAILAVAAGAVAVWMTVRLVNRRRDRTEGDFDRWVLYNAASLMKRASTKPINGQHKLIHRAGLALMGIGLLLILSVFGALIAGFGTLGNYEGPGKTEVFRAFGGLILTMVGRFLVDVAATGSLGFRFISRSEFARINADQKKATIVRTLGHPVWDIDAVAKFEGHRK